MTEAHSEGPCQAWLDTAADHGSRSSTVSQAHTFPRRELENSSDAQQHGVEHRTPGNHQGRQDRSLVQSVLGGRCDSTEKRPGGEIAADEPGRGRMRRTLVTGSAGGGERQRQGSDRWQHHRRHHHRPHNEEQPELGRRPCTPMGHPHVGSLSHVVHVPRATSRVIPSRNG